MAETSNNSTNNKTNLSTSTTPLHYIFTKILKEYNQAKNESFAGHSLGKDFRESIPEIFYSTGFIDKNIYAVKGSAGQGNWADVPWIGIFNRAITTSAQKGVYIVYLFSSDCSSLYLTLNQGCTTIKDTYGRKHTEDFLDKNTKHITSEMDPNVFNSDDEIELNVENNSLGYFYEKGAIYYKRYEASNIPSEHELKEDLKNMLNVYQEYVNKCNGPNGFKAYEDSLIANMRGRAAENANQGARDIGTSTNKASTNQRAKQDMKNGESLTVKQKIEHIKSYIEAKGFSYEDGLIENFYLSLKAKPFVILAGTSGTGKSRLVRLFAEAVGALEAPDATDAGTKKSRFMMVPVRPDWSDSSDLFGHVDLNGKFIPGEIIGFIKDANKHIDMPYFLCLDEMNLARVEYYLSDILSVMETREIKTQEDGSERIVTDPLVKNDYYGEDKDAENKYGEISIPENLYIIGTVNMDETTFPFSRKVLDRANTIEFSYVDLSKVNYRSDDKKTPSDPAAINNLFDNSFFRADYVSLSQCGEKRESVDKYCNELNNINMTLQKADAQVGYRVRDEIVFYMLYNKEYGIIRDNDVISDNDAFDYELMQKILPRISGSSSAVRDMLYDLFKICVGQKTEGSVKTEGNDSISSKMQSDLNDAIYNKSCKYRRSAKKIIFMMRRLEEDGFTSYWL